MGKHSRNIRILNAIWTNIGTLSLNRFGAFCEIAWNHLIFPDTAS